MADDEKEDLPEPQLWKALYTIAMGILMVVGLAGTAIGWGHWGDGVNMTWKDILVPWTMVVLALLGLPVAGLLFGRRWLQWRLSVHDRNTRQHLQEYGKAHERLLAEHSSAQARLLEKQGEAHTALLTEINRRLEDQSAAFATLRSEVPEMVDAHLKQTGRGPSSR